MAFWQFGKALAVLNPRQPKILKAKRTTLQQQDPKEKRLIKARKYANLCQEL